MTYTLTVRLGDVVEVQEFTDDKTSADLERLYWLSQGVQVEVVATPTYH